jgi:hypothetical protein
MPQKSEPHLSPAAKEAVNSYLWKILAVIGIPNLLFILVAFVYLLFVLPNRAVTEAKVLIQQEAATINEALLDSSLESIEKAGRAQERTDNALERAAVLENDLDRLEANMRSIRIDKVNELGRILVALDENPDIAEAIKLAPRVSSLEGRMTHWGEQVRTVGYGSGAYAHTARSADCPEGFYATGIRVTYRGTCLDNCNEDGGIIGNIELVCRTQ